MKKIVISIVAALAVALSMVVTAPAASAHRWTSWYWSPWHAEFKYEARYDVRRTECFGWGRWIYDQNRRYRMYKHFDCYVWHWDGTKEEDELHVKSRRGFVVYD